MTKQSDDKTMTPTNDKAKPAPKDELSETEFDKAAGGWGLTPSGWPDGTTNNSN